MSGNGFFADLKLDIIAQYTPSLTGYRIQLSAATLVFYDYLLTFPVEVSFIWTGRLNLMKVLFLVNRYTGIVFQLAALVLYFFKPATDAINDTFFNTGMYGIFMMRTFAIYGKKWSVLFVLAIPALVDTVANIWGIVADTASAHPRQFQVHPDACNLMRIFLFTPAFSHNDVGSLIDSVATTVFDALVVILTVYRTARHVKRSRQVDIHGSLSYILLHNGIVFYVVIFLPVFVTFAMYAIALKGHNINLSYIANDFVAILIAFRNVAVNRLVLNLSAAAKSEDDLEYRTRTGLDPPVFAANSILGNIGGLVRSNPVDIDEELEEAAGNEEGIDIDDGSKLEAQDSSVSLVNVGEVRELDTTISSHPGARAEIEEISV